MGEAGIEGEQRQQPGQSPVAIGEVNGNPNTEHQIPNTESS